jgi:hypothetical protein
MMKGHAVQLRGVHWRAIMPRNLSGASKLIICAIVSGGLISAVLAQDDPPESTLPTDPALEAPSMPMQRSGNEIYSNSGSIADPFRITRPAGGCSSRDLTDVQTVLGLGKYAENCLSPRALADDFVVPPGQTWTITEIVFYLYQTRAPYPTVSTIRVGFQDTDPLGQSVPSLVSYAPLSQMIAVERSADNEDPLFCNKRLQQCIVTLSPAYVATAGTHFLIWQGETSDPNYSGPWSPLVTLPGAAGKPGANARYLNSGSGFLFAESLDAGVPQDLVFVLRGAIDSGARPGDLNCDQVVDFKDINPFVLALTGQAAYQAAFPNCRYLNADCNNDAVVDFKDINPFVALLAGG